MKPLQNAILTTPERWGQTGFAGYNGNGAWTFYPDDLSVSSSTHPRSEICIPRLDRTKTFTPPRRPGPFERIWNDVCDAHIARKSKTTVLVPAKHKPGFMEALDKIMTKINKAGRSELEVRDALIANIESGLLFAVRRKGTKLWKAPVYPVEQYKSLGWDLVSLGKPSDTTSRLERLIRLNEKKTTNP